MRLLLVHLSDLHLDAEGNNQALLRADLVVSAALGNVPGVSHFLLIGTGDFIDKGQAEAFQWATLFLHSLEAAVRKHSQAITYLPPILVPGNHDTVRPASAEDAFVASQARASLLENPTRFTPNDVTVSLCLRQQDAFREFQATIPGVSITTQAERLAYIQEFNLQPNAVQVVALNTAWMSESDNDQSNLLAWLPQLPSESDQWKLRIVAMHHPSSWLNRENGRSIERTIHQYADIVLSGHEHRSEHFVRHKDGGASNAFFEGDSLSGPAGGFAAIAIDFNSQQRKTFPFLWTGEMYAVVTDRPWVPLRRGIGAAHDGFQLSLRFEEFLDDPGLATSSTIHLADIFVYPRLRDITLEVKDGKADSPNHENPTLRRSGNREIPKQKRSHEGTIDPIIGASDVLSTLSDANRLLIVGETRSGKSTLLRKYFRDLRSMGFVPLFLKPEDCLDPSLDALHSIVRHRAEEQYDDAGGQRYVQVPLSKRVILVDELHSINLTSSQLRNLMLGIRQLAQYSIIAGDDLFLLRQVWAAFKDKDLLDLKIFKLLTLDPKQQRELAAKMQAALGPSDTQAFDDGALDRLERNLTDILGERIVTPFASEVKTILRELLCSSAGGNFGAYGFYYDSQIKSDLSVGLQEFPKDVLEPQYDVIEAFLAQLARRLYDSGDYHASEEDFDQLIDHFRQQKIAIEKSGLLLVLLRARILVQRESGYVFRERYQRYYFMALHLAKMLANEATATEAKSILADLVAKIHEKEASDVVLFTIYLTNSQWLLDLLTCRSELIFAELNECDMNTDFLFAQQHVDSIIVSGNSIPELGEESVMSDTETRRERDARNKELDEMLYGTLRTMSEAFNVLNILGLAVRNYPVRIDVKLRERMIESGYALSLRSLSAFINLIREGKSELEILASKHLGLTADRGLIASQLVSLCSFGIVRRSVLAFGSPHLELSLSDVWKDDKRVSARMIRFGVLLDLRKCGSNEAAIFWNDMKENRVGQVVLMYVVANHLRSFRASRERRLPLCNAVKLDPDNPAFFYDRGRPKSIGSS